MLLLLLSISSAVAAETGFTKTSSITSTTEVEGSASINDNTIVASRYVTLLGISILIGTGWFFFRQHAITIKAEQES